MARCKNIWAYNCTILKMERWKYQWSSMCKIFWIFLWGNRRFCNIASCMPSLADKIWGQSNVGFSTRIIGQVIPSPNGTIVIYFICRKKRYPESYWISYHEVDETWQGWLGGSETFSEVPKGCESHEVYLVGGKPVCYLIVGRCFVYHPPRL